MFYGTGHGGGTITKKIHTTQAIVIAICVVFGLMPLAGAAETTYLINDNLKQSLEQYINQKVGSNAIINQSLAGMTEEEIAALQNWLKDRDFNTSINGTNLAINNLTVGASGENVVALQKWLQENNFYFGEIDGKFGVDTENAVKQFQKEVGLKEDGSAGVYTLQSMQQWDDYVEQLVSEESTVNAQVTSSSNSYATRHTYSYSNYRRSYSYSGKGVGDCWTNSDMMYNQYTNSGQRARIIQYGTSLSSRHRSVQVWNGNSWVNADYSGYGYRYQPTGNSVNGVVIKSS